MKNAVRALGIAGLLLAVTSIWMQKTFPIPGREIVRECAVERGVGVILALELPRSVDELQCLANETTARPEALAATRGNLQADRLLILSYWLFLAGTGVLVSRQRFSGARLLGWTTVAVATAAALGDVLENHLIAQALEQPEAIDAAATRLLRWVSWGKWLTFYGAAGLGSAAYLSRRGLLRVIGLLFAVAAVVGVGVVFSRGMAFQGMKPFSLALLSAIVVLLFVPGRFIDEH